MSFWCCRNEKWKREKKQKQNFLVVVVVVVFTRIVIRVVVAVVVRKTLRSIRNICLKIVKLVGTTTFCLSQLNNTFALSLETVNVIRLLSLSLVLIRCKMEIPESFLPVVLLCVGGGEWQCTNTYVSIVLQLVLAHPRMFDQMQRMLRRWPQCQWVKWYFLAPNAHGSCNGIRCEIIKKWIRVVWMWMLRCEWRRMGKQKLWRCSVKMMSMVESVVG